MRVVTIDFETYWSKTHSLSKIPALTYVMHPDTEVISMAIKEDSGDAQVVFGEAAIAQHLSAQDFSDAVLVAHNMSGFDAMILAWRFGVTPKIWACTLAMARPIHAKTTGLALGKLVEHYGIGVKDNTVLIATQGRHLCDFTPQERVDMERYNKEDTDQCYALFNALLPNYTSKELWQIDATIRMLVESRFTLNRYLLETALRDERQRKQDSIMQLAKALQATPKASLAIQIATPDTIEEAVRAELASAPKFGALLRSFDVEVPMKPSPTNPEKLVPALAKTDSAFLALQEHDNPLVAAAARTRLDVKSSLLETRLEAFIAAGKATRGKLPIPLHYCGADTTGRWCLAEDTPILVKDEHARVFEVPIQDVLPEWLLWDGVEWVSHDGVVFSGDKEVITWDGVTATPEHIVWISADVKVTLGYAAEHGICLWSGNRVPDI